jgi:hypothetical protein
MKKLLILLLIAILTSPAWAQCVMGVESNGPDQATLKAFEWRAPEVYQKIYEAAGFKVVLVSKSNKGKVQQALDENEITHITGCGHGSPTVYTGHGNAHIFSTSDKQLLAKLKGKHIHLLSCLTAQQLGPAMMENGAKSFAGYHPSFYFTWKSAFQFFEADAALDIAFANGKSAPQAYKQTIDKFNETLDKLSKSDPSAVKYIVIDRDGLRCFPTGDRVELTYDFPMEVADYYLYAIDPQTGKYVSYAESFNLETRSSLDSMDAEQFKALVIANYEQLDREFELGIIGEGVLNRDQLIEEIKLETELGKQLIEVDKYFTDKLEQSRLTQTIEMTTDAKGSIIATGNFEASSKLLVKEVKVTWEGEQKTLGELTINLNNNLYFSEKNIEKDKVYKKYLKVFKGTVAYAINAVGAPANTTVKVTLTLCPT